MSRVFNSFLPFDRQIVTKTEELEEFKQFPRKIPGKLEKINLTPIQKWRNFGVFMFFVNIIQTILNLI